MDKIRDIASAIIMAIALVLLFVGATLGVAIFYTKGSLL